MSIFENINLINESLYPYKLLALAMVAHPSGCFVGNG